MVILLFTLVNYENKYQPLLLNGIPFPVFFFGLSYAEALEKNALSLSATLFLL